MITLASIRKEVVHQAPRIVILGTEKIGKTTFACGSRFEGGKLAEIGLNHPIVMPMRGEEGADALDVASFPTLASYADIQNAIGALYSENHDFSTVVLDSASAAALVINEDVCAEFKTNNIRKVPGFRTGEAAIMARWRDILNGLDALRESKGMASIIIGHTKIKKHKNPEGDDYDCYDFDLEFGDVAELLKRWADVILFATTKVAVVKESQGFGAEKSKAKDISGGRRFLYTQPRPAHPGGGRGIYGALPYELPLDWAAFQDAIGQAMTGSK